uniref:hypothetical protein n=1 Tax=Ornithinimicrobium sufpigmenti TaxID=2508882 RepID=UPI0037CAF668
MRHRLCGRVVQGNGAPVTLRTSRLEDGTERAGWGGVQTCGSVWACAICSAKIAHLRQQEIASALTAWRSIPGAGDVALLTLTMRHRKGQKLATLWGALSDAWNHVTRGRAWGVDQLGAGILMQRVVKSGKRKGQTVTDVKVPWIKATEVTVSYDNGWHVHLHVVIFLREGVTTSAQTALFGGIWRRWRDGLVAAGLDAPRAHLGGLDIRPVDLASGDVLSEYFTKAVYSASAEVARGDLKSGRRGGRTPMQVLRDLVEGDRGVVRDDVDPAEFEAVMAEDRPSGVSGNGPATVAGRSRGLAASVTCWAWALSARMRNWQRTTMLPATSC